MTGRVAIVTGSTRGIGLATARRFAEAGARVVISSRKLEACEAVRAELAAAGHDVLAVAAHAARREDLARLVDATLSHFGRLDVVVANAATNPVFDPLTELPEESWVKILNTNLAGPLHLARLALPHIAAGGGGSGAYGISKAALEQMARQLAVEWGGRGVRINAVAPGTIRTDMIRSLTARPEFIEAVVRATPLRRIGEADDVAAAVLFLACEAARHITGQVLTIDGGQTIARGSF
jgi:dehydrogenase/reductase SDR family protein 4